MKKYKVIYGVEKTLLAGAEHFITAESGSQAAEIAKKAQVEKLYLVHISPRYLDHHVLENDARKIFNNSFVPKDFQEVEISLKK
jgi:ribonuclease BN (tRNA processing enzyme)